MPNARLCTIEGAGERCGLGHIAEQHPAASHKHLNSVQASLPRSELNVNRMWCASILQLACSGSDSQQCLAAASGADIAFESATLQTFRASFRPEALVMAAR